MSFKQKKRLFLSITEKIGDRAFSVRKTRIQNEYIEKKYKVFQELNISNVSIFLLTVNPTHSF